MNNSMNNSTDITVRHIMETIRRAVGRNVADGSPSGGAPNPAPGRWPLPDFFRPVAIDVTRRSYDVQELLRYRDGAFVSIAYQALLKREADPDGLENYLRVVRTDPAGKVGVLASLRYSAEGRARRVRVRGLPWEWFKRLLQKPPLLGGLMRFLFFSGASREERLRELVDETGRALEWMAARTQQELDAKADRQDMADKADRRDMDGYLRSVGHVLDMIKEIHDPKRQEKSPPAGLDALDAYDGPWLDELYLSFEEAFRGSGAVIRERLEVYLPALTEVAGRVALPGTAAGLPTGLHTGLPAGLPAGCAVLDLGCGRGEFLELLAEKGISAMGVDENRFMVQQALERNACVRQVDIFEFLDGLPSGCLAAVTAFQVIEHLSFQRQLLLLDQIRRVLVPGGLVVLETPNPCNLLAGSVDFLRDPTHLRPVHPDTLLFLARSRGFARAGIFFPEEAEASEMDASGSKIKPAGLILKDAAQVSFTELQDYVRVARDYALIAGK